MNFKNLLILTLFGASLRAGDREVSGASPRSRTSPSSRSRAASFPVSLPIAIPFGGSIEEDQDFKFGAYRPRSRVHSDLNGYKPGDVITDNPVYGKQLRRVRPAIFSVGGPGLFKFRPVSIPEGSSRAAEPSPVPSRNMVLSPGLPRVRELSPEERRELETAQKALSDWNTTGFGHDRITADSVINNLLNGVTAVLAGKMSRDGLVRSYPDPRIGMILTELEEKRSQLAKELMQSYIECMQDQAARRESLPILNLSGQYPTVGNVFRAILGGYTSGDRDSVRVALAGTKSIDDLLDGNADLTKAQLSILLKSPTAGLGEHQIRGVSFESGLPSRPVSATASAPIPIPVPKRRAASGGF